VVIADFLKSDYKTSVSAFALFFTERHFSRWGKKWGRCRHSPEPAAVLCRGSSGRTASGRFRGVARNRKKRIQQRRL